MVIDHIRRGTHDRADVTGPCRGCATAVSCRAASRTSRRACPLPSPAVHTAHRWRNLKSRATCDSPVTPRSPTDVPSPCGQRRRRIHPDNFYRLQADAIRGCNPAQISAITMVTHARATGGGVPDVSLLLPPGRVHPVCMTYGTCSLQAHQSSRIGRQRPPCAWQSHASIWTRISIRICRIWGKLSAHTAGPYQYATNASFKLDGRDLLAPCASLPPHRWTPRGRMRGVGATCTAPTTHERPKRMKAPECCKIGAG